MKNENKITFAILKEKISPENVLAMAELIAISETKFQIGYIGSRMQKLHTDLYIDIMHKNDVNHTLSNAYDLVQECGLFLCQHFGKHLNKKWRVCSYIDESNPPSYPTDYDFHIQFVLRYLFHFIFGLQTITFIRFLNKSGSNRYLACRLVKLLYSILMLRRLTRFDIQIYVIDDISCSCGV